MFSLLKWSICTYILISTWYWSFFLSGEYVISSVLSHHNKNLKRWTSVTAFKQIVSQFLDRSVLQLRVISQFYLENEGKYIIEAWGLPKRRKEKRETPGPLAPLFVCFFYSPLSLLYVNWASQEWLFVLPKVLTPVPGPSFVLFSPAFPILVF